jgi:hypothetical protein
VSILFEHCSDAANSFAHSVTVIDDALKRGTYLIEVRFISRKPTQARIAISDYRSQRLVDLVND